MTTSWVTLCPTLTEQWAILPLRTAKIPKTERPDAVQRPGQREAARSGGGGGAAGSQGWDSSAWSSRSVLTRLPGRQQ